MGVWRRNAREPVTSRREHDGATCWVRAPGILYDATTRSDASKIDTRLLVCARRGPGKTDQMAVGACYAGVSNGRLRPGSPNKLLSSLSTQYHLGSDHDQSRATDARRSCAEQCRTGAEHRWCRRVKLQRAREEREKTAANKFRKHRSKDGARKLPAPKHPSIHPT